MSDARDVLFHPFSLRLPSATEDEFQSLKADIKVRGLRRPIALLDGMVWDGRARLRALSELDMPAKFRLLRHADDPILYLMMRNASRCGAPNSGERAAYVSLLSPVEAPGWRAAVQQRRTEWISKARREFRNIVGRPQPCAVCARHEEFVHAHHCLPLKVQFDLGLANADHEHDWLCPTHHRHIHMMIGVYMTGTREGDFLDHVPDDRVTEWFQIEDVYRRGEDLFRIYGGVHQNARGSDPEYAV